MVLIKLFLKAVPVESCLSSSITVKVLVFYFTYGSKFDQAIQCHKERQRIAFQLNDKAAERRAYSNMGNGYIFLGKQAVLSLIASDSVLLPFAISFVPCSGFDICFMSIVTNLRKKNGPTGRDSTNTVTRRCDKAVIAYPPTSRQVITWPRSTPTAKVSRFPWSWGTLPWRRKRLSLSATPTC